MKWPTSRRKEDKKEEKIIMDLETVKSAPSQDERDDEQTVDTFLAREALKTIDVFAKRHRVSRRDVILFARKNRKGKREKSDDETIETVAMDGNTYYDSDDVNKTIMDDILDGIDRNCFGITDDCATITDDKSEKTRKISWPDFSFLEDPCGCTAPTSFCFGEEKRTPLLPVTSNVRSVRSAASGDLTQPTSFHGDGYDPDDAPPNEATITPEKITPENLQVALQSGYGNEFVGQVDVGTPEAGQGSFRCLKTGVEYSGVFKRGTMDGWGTCVYSSGSVYEGEWKNGKREGLGMFRFVNGDVYQGSFKDGKREGLGSYVYSDGGMYQGHFRNNFREGKGRYRFTNGDSYEGQYKGDMRDGKGTYRSANGNVYKGLWKNDMREGPGKFRWADGAVFEGTWKSNVKHGAGTFVTADGKMFDEKWNNGGLVFRKEAKD